MTSISAGSLSVSEPMRHLWMLAYTLGTALVIVCPLGAQLETPTQQRALAPSRPSFDTVSVKPHIMGGRGTNMTKVVIDPKTMRLNAISAGETIELAYGVTAQQISPIAGWLNTSSYDIVGVSAAPATGSEQKLMLQGVLEDRFGLAYRRTVKDGPVYELIAGKSPALTPSKEGASEGGRFFPRMVVNPDGSTETVFSASGASMSDLSLWLSGLMGRPVVDRTAINGLFEIKLSIPGPSMNSASSGPVMQFFDPGEDLKVSVRSQMGLVLRPGRGPVQVFEIEHIQEPSPN